MAKRRGANSRKNRIGRAGKHRRLGRLIFVGAVVLAATISGTALLHRTGAVRVVPFVGRFFHPHGSMVTSLCLVGSEHVMATEMTTRLGLRFPMPFRQVKKIVAKQWDCVNPWIAGAELCGPHEGIVTVMITERKPVAIVGKSVVCFVDTAGAYIPFDPRRAQHLPLVSGLRDSAGADGRRCLIASDRGRMNRLFRGLAAFDPQVALRITQMHFAPCGTVALWLEGSSTEIALDGNNLTDGLDRLVRLLPSVRSDSGFPARIDLSCRNLAFVTIGATAGGSVEKARQKG